jgi:hypothetical protein
MLVSVLAFNCEPTSKVREKTEGIKSVLGSPSLYFGPFSSVTRLPDTVQAYSAGRIHDTLRQTTLCLVPVEDSLVEYSGSWIGVACLKPQCSQDVRTRAGFDLTSFLTLLTDLNKLKSEKLVTAHRKNNIENVGTEVTSG